MPSLVISFTDEEFSILTIAVEMAGTSRLSLEQLMKTTGKKEAEVKFMLQKLQDKLKEGKV